MRSFAIANEIAERGITGYAWAVASYNPGRFKMAEAASPPLLVEDHVKAARVMIQTFGTYLGEEFSGVHVLAIAVISPKQFHPKTPINSIDDLAGLRLRSSAATVSAALRALGADPVAMPVTEQYESLQRGIVDRSVALWATVAAFRINEVTKHPCPREFRIDESGGQIVELSEEDHARIAEMIQPVIDAELDTRATDGLPARAYFQVLRDGMAALA